MKILCFIIFLAISCNGSELVSNNVLAYDIILDYVNQLVYTVYVKDNVIYNQINYYDNYKITSELKSINISNVIEIKMDYNPIVYKNLSRYDRAVMAILTKNITESIYIYKCDNFGYNKINNTYRWELVDIIESNTTNLIFDLSVNLGEYYDERIISLKPPNMSRWIICYTERYTNVSCLGSNDGIEWVHPHIVYDINEDTNCSSLKIIKTAFDTWGTFCYDTYRYKIKNYGFILFNQTFIMENIEIPNIISYKDNIVFSSKFYDDNNFNSIIVVNNTVYRLLYVRNIYFDNNITIEGEITNIVLKPEDNGWYFIVNNSVYLTYDRSNYTYINTIDGDIKEVINIYDDKLMIVTFDNGKLYTTTYSIYTDDKEWPFIPSKNDTVDISYIEGNIILDGGINIIYNTSVTIDGNLDINTNLVLNKTDTIIINGKLSINGNITIYVNSSEDIIIFKFDDHNNKTFDNVNIISDKKICNERLEYTDSTISVLFDPIEKCADNSFVSSREFIMIISFCILFVIIAISFVLVIKFKRKIFPYRDKKYFIENKN